MWEITGAEFSSSNIHTAAGISIRFPRVTRIRDDKDWTNATDLDRLKVSVVIVESFLLRCTVEPFYYIVATIGECNFVLYRGVDLSQEWPLWEVPL